MVVIVSGCVDEADDILDSLDNDNEETTTAGGHGEDSPNTDRGLEIVEFQVLNPEIESRDDAVGTTIELVLRNYHSDPVFVEEMSIYDSSLLDVRNMECTPRTTEGLTNDDGENVELEPAQEDFAPEIFCEWDVIPPSPEDFGGYDQRRFSPTLYLEYESLLENEDPLQVEFRDRDDIREMSALENSFTNNEVSMTKTVEQQPVPTSSERAIDFELRNDGPGILGEMESGEDFEVEFSPENVYGDNCENGVDESIDIGSSVEFSCDLSFSQEVTRNLFTAVRYKYIKEPSVDVTVVN